MKKQRQLQQQAAQAACELITDDAVIGVGSGSTVGYFIAELAQMKGKISAAVASSNETEQQLQQYHIPTEPFNSVSQIDFYIDSADEITSSLYCSKGGGGALTGEKILAQAAQQFICIADESKYVNMLGDHPVAIEVIPMARSYIARQMVKLGGDPIYREGFRTDYNHIILDIHNLDIYEPLKLEHQLNMLPGIVTNGIFANRRADQLLLATKKGLQTIYPST